MATFYWNSGKKEDIVTQWVDYLQHEAYVKDVNQIITQNSKEISDIIRSGTTEQVKAINTVCGSIENMNHGINKKLENIDYNVTELRGEINSMAAMISWKLSQIIEELRITNQLLGFIAKLLKIPDSQKQRVYYIEQGIKYLKNAFMENDVNSSFYNDAFEELKKSEKIERRDYITLNRIGQIHLYSKKYLDFEKAELYFLKSARESMAESNVRGTNVSNLTIGDYKKDIYSEKPFLTATAESYLYAARACYLQKKMGEAIKYSRKAFDLIPDFLQAGFEQAKYLGAANRVEESRSLLKMIILKDRYFSIKTAKDLDLISKIEIVQLLEDFYLQSKKKALDKLKVIESKIGKQSEASNTLNEIKHHISKNNFLSNMKALDMFDANYNFDFFTFREDGYNIFKKRVNPSLSLEEFIENENNVESELRYLKLKLENKKKKEIEKKFLHSVAKGALIFGGIVGIIVFLAFLGCLLSSSFGNCFAMFMVYTGGAAFIGAILGAIVGLLTRPYIEIKVK